MALSARLRELNSLHRVHSIDYIDHKDEINLFADKIKAIIRNTTETKLEREKLGDNLYSYYDKSLLNNQFLTDLKEFAKNSTRNIFLVDWFNNDVEEHMKVEITTQLDYKEPFFIVLPNPKFVTVQDSSGNSGGQMIVFNMAKGRNMSVSFRKEDGEVASANGVDFGRLMNHFEDHDDILEMRRENDFRGSFNGDSYSNFNLISWNHLGCFVNFATFIKGYSIELSENEFPKRNVPECIITPSVPFDRHFTSTMFGKLFEFLNKLPNKTEREVIKKGNQYISYMHDFFARLKETNKNKIRVAMTDISQLRQSLFNKEKEARELEALKRSLESKIGKTMTKELDTEKVTREFRWLMKKFKAIDLGLSDRICAVTHEIECTTDNNEDGKEQTYLLGEFLISIFFTGNITIKNLTRRLNNYDHPHVNDTIPCLGTTARILPQLIMDGGFLSALDILYGFLESYADRDGFAPFHKISYWPVKPEVEETTERTVLGAVSNVMLEDFEPLTGEDIEHAIEAHERLEQESITGTIEEGMIS